MMIRVSNCTLNLFACLLPYPGQQQQVHHHPCILYCWGCFGTDRSVDHTHPHGHTLITSFLVAMVLVIVLVIVGVLVWKKKKRYAVDKETGDRTNLNYGLEENTIDNPAYPKEAAKQKKLKFKAKNSRFSTGAPDVDPLSQFRPVAVEGDQEEEEEEDNHEIAIDEAPGLVDDDDKQVLY